MFFSTNSILIIIFLMPGLLLFSVFAWRAAFKVALIFVVFEGVFRKWILPESSNIIFFFKDVMLLGSYFGCFCSGRFKLFQVLRRSSIALPLLLYASWVFVDVWNPNLPNRSVGLLGLKMHLFYIPIIAMVGQVFYSPKHVLRFLRWYLYLSIPVIILAFFQFFSPRDSILNIYAGGISSTSSLGQFVRVVGTFPYLTGFSTYLSLIIVIGFGLLIEKQFSLKGNWLVVITLVLAFIAVPMTGARALVFTLFINLCIFLFFLYKKGFLNFRLFFILLLIPSLFFLTFNFGTDKALNSYIERSRSCNDIVDRIKQLFKDPVDLADHAGFFGYGVGSAYPAASFVVSDSSEQAFSPLIYENETAKLIMELGFIGFILFIMCKLIICRISYLSMMLSKSASEFGLGLISLMFLLPYVLLNSIYDVTASIYYWFLVGVVAMLLQVRNFPNVKPISHRKNII